MIVKRAPVELLRSNLDIVVCYLHFSLIHYSIEIKYKILETGARTDEIDCEQLAHTLHKAG